MKVVRVLITNWTHFAHSKKLKSKASRFKGKDFDWSLSKSRFVNEPASLVERLPKNSHHFRLAGTFPMLLRFISRLSSICTICSAFPWTAFLLWIAQGCADIPITSAPIRPGTAYYRRQPLVWFPLFPNLDKFSNVTHHSCAIQAAKTSEGWNKRRKNGTTEQVVATGKRCIALLCVGHYFIQQ